MPSINLLYNTIRPLKTRQIFFRLFYLARNKSNLQRNPYKVTRQNAELKPVQIVSPIFKQESYIYPRTFHFLNQKYEFKNNIDWNYSGYGKLWTYNLNYFDFINQENVSRQTGLGLIRDFIESESNLIEGKEPYPTSLRLINWLKFVYRYGIRDDKVNRFMIDDLHNLSRNVEYHLLANHLLENAIALTIGGYCLRQQTIFKQGISLLTEELDEQICDDGAHFEKSPMYHQILLDRLLDSINFLGENHLLKKAAVSMLSWLDTITFSDGSIPHFNDSTSGISPTTAQLKRYAGTLGIRSKKTHLRNSGYRKYTSDNYELIADGGDIGPSYQAGHGHCDAGSFVLYVNQKPFIIDTGTSTYEPNDRRTYERSVESHNTSHPAGVEPCELWSSFRIARREAVHIKNASTNSLKITRSLPYEKKQVLTRSFKCYNNRIDILDKTNIKDICKAYLHFSPDVDVIQTNFGLKTPEAEIHLKNCNSFRIEDCEITDGFNRLKKTQKLVAAFTNHMGILIHFVK
ncbi:MAG: alginate lyase family protein [Balneolales bacterium]